jgi:nitroimidazol reductase NimA-like FMN-containing flavoprotein (pyridoxamine 5'-phosphate oxidase superfamily)
MRQSKREITLLQDVLEVIKRCDVCRVGLYDCEGVYIVPMNFGYELTEGKLILWFHCAVEGRKIDIIGSGNRAGFEMDTDHKLVVADKACGYSMKFSSVIGHGHIAVAGDDETRMRGLRLIMEHYGGGDLPFDEKIVSRTCVLRLTADEFTGKRLQ